LYLHYFYFGECRGNFPIKGNSIQVTLRRSYAVLRAYYNIEIQ